MTNKLSRICLDLLNDPLIKNNIKKMINPLVEPILDEIYPYIYVSLTFVIISFLLHLAILIILIKKFTFSNINKKT